MDKHYIKLINRTLTHEETNIICNFRYEINMNNYLIKLYRVIQHMGLAPPFLPDSDGNCLFESFRYFINEWSDTYSEGSHVEVKEMRRMIAFIMMKKKDVKNFLPGQDSTMGELFDNINEIEYVIVRNGKSIVHYKYSYELMCQDLASESSWDRLPTQLILLVMSYIYKVKIHIIHTNGYTSIINAFDNDNPDYAPNIKTLYLGNLEEIHYIPLTTNKTPLFYNQATAKMKHMLLIEIQKQQIQRQQTENEQIQKTEIQPSQQTIDHVQQVQIQQFTDDQGNQDQMKSHPESPKTNALNNTLTKF